MVPMNTKAFAKLVSLSVFAVFCGSCTPARNSSFLRRTTSAASDHIMLVRQNPSSLGFQRLSAFSLQYPDLAVFLSQRRYPDFLAETNKGGNRYLILYYLESRNAFACRCGERGSIQVEFSGPYPITDGEAKTLRDLRDRVFPDAPDGE
jgi:hypothetical protein